MMMKDERFEEALKTNGLQGTVTKEGLPEKDYKILRDVLFMDDDKRYDDLHEFTWLFIRSGGGDTGGDE